MTGLTMALSAYLRSVAGPEFTYPGVTGAGRPSNRHPSGGSPRRGLKAWLLAAQGGLCPCCGEGLALAEAEFSHVAARGPKVSGFIPGNVYAGCRAGNSRMAPEWTDGPAVEATMYVGGEAHTVSLPGPKVLIKGVDVQTPDHLGRPDLVPTEWPCQTTGGFRVYAD